MLMGPQKEAAAIVLSRALSFLKANRTPLKQDIIQGCILDDRQRLGMYAKLMLRIKKYRADSSMMKPVNLAMSGFQVEKHRIANVNTFGDRKSSWGETRGSVASIEKRDVDASIWRRSDHHGLKMTQALEKMLPGDEDDKVHATRPHRFFANLDPQTLCEQHYGAEMFDAIRALERSAVGHGDKANMPVHRARCNRSAGDG